MTTDPYIPPAAKIIAPLRPSKWDILKAIAGIIWGFISIVVATVFILIMIYLYNDMGGFFKAWNEVFDKCRESGDQSYMFVGIAINIVWLSIICGFGYSGYRFISNSIKNLRTR